MKDADFRAGIRRGLQEAIEIVEWEERKWKPGARPASNVARTRQGRATRCAAFNAAKMKLFQHLKRYERQHYSRGDPFTGFSIIVGDAGQ